MPYALCLMPYALCLMPAYTWLSTRMSFMWTSIGSALMRTALPRQERVSKRTLVAAELTKPELTKPLATERADAHLTAASVARGLVVRVERDTQRDTHKA